MGLDAAGVFAAGEVVQPAADGAVAPHQEVFRAAPQIADQGEVVALQALLQGAAHAPQPADRLAVEEIQRLAEVSDPKVTIDTSGMNPEATELANQLARNIAKLSADDLGAIRTEIIRRAGRR